MITSGYAVRIDNAPTKPMDPERPEGVALPVPGREADAAECNEALRVLARHIGADGVREVRKMLFGAGVLRVEKDGAR